MATNHRSDPGRIKTESPDTQRDLAAKGGPAVGIGDAQNRKATSPVSEDTQTQSAIKSGQEMKDHELKEENAGETKTDKRHGNGL